MAENFGLKSRSKWVDRWDPTEEQNTGPISRVSEFFIGELNELQEDLKCLDEFIYDFMEAIKTRWLPDSCHNQARNLKREHLDVN